MSKIRGGGASSMENRTLRDAVLQPRASGVKTCSPGKSAPVFGSRRNAGTSAGTASDSVRTQMGRELACYDGFAANLWALNSAVECHLHTLAIDPPAIDSKDVR